MAQTSQMISYQPYSQTLIVCAAKLLGVYFRHAFNFSKYVESVVAICNQRLFLLAQLKQQGPGICALDSVFNVIMLNKILYALPVFTSAPPPLQ